MAAGLVTLARAGRDQRLRNRPLGSATVEIAQGRGTRRDAEGGPEPGSGRRGLTGERRTTGNQRKAAKGENPAGKRETGGKPAGGTGGREVRPQTTR